uniref:leucine-rich repeat domain-containing protein n=1 Tax=Zhenpiania hominis TaxID=2763644 RepID=UPI0039F4CC33
MNLPKSMKEIGYSAFEGCSNLKTVKMAYNSEVEYTAELGNAVFRDCTSLNSVGLSENVVSIGNYIFSGCTQLSSLELPDSLKEVGYRIIESTAIESITIPKNVEYSDYDYSSADPNGALANNKQLKEVIFAEGMKKIPAYIMASSGYTSYVTKVEIPESVTEIGYSAFYSSENLVLSSVPSKVEKIGDCAFEGCTAITEMNLPKSMKEIGYSAFEGCIALEEVLIPNKVTEIESETFRGCTALKVVRIPRTVTTIASNAFSECPEVTIYGYEGSYAQTYATDNNIPFVVLDDEEEDVSGIGFNLKFDGHCVINSESCFNYEPWINLFGIFGYKIPLERYQEVFGPSYTKHIYKQNISVWGGNCFGMSATAALFYKGRLNVSDYTNQAGALAAVGYDDMSLSEGKAYLRLDKDSALTKLIERYQIWQDSIEFERDYVKDILNYEATSDAELFSKVITKIRDTREPLIVGVNWKTEENKSAGHALVVNSSRLPEDLGDGWVRIYLYDPNNPYFGAFGDRTPVSAYNQAENRYVDVNTSTGQWKMAAMVNGDGGSITSIGYDDAGNLLSGSNIAFVDANGYPSNFAGKATFSPSEDNINIAYTSDNFEVYTSENELIYKRENGSVKTLNKDVVTDFTGYGYVEGLETGLATGKLILPSGKYSVKVEGGSIAYLEEGDYAGVVTKQEATITNPDTTGVSVTAPLSTEVNLVLEDNRNEDYTSVETDLLVDENGCDVSLNDDTLTVDADKTQKIDIGVITEEGETEIKNVDVDEVNQIELQSPDEDDTTPVRPSKPTTPGTKAKQTITAKSFTKTYGNKAFSLGAKAKTKLSYKSSNTKVATVNSTGKVTLKGPGKTTITITAAATTNYNAASKSITITVKPKKVTLKKAKSTKKRTLKVMWKRDTKATGYQVVIAQNKKFRKAKKTALIKKNKTTSRTFKKLKSRKNYYYKVRAYKQVGKTKIYGSYSKVKKVKVR